MLKIAAHIITLGVVLYLSREAFLVLIFLWGFVYAEDCA